MPTWLEVAAARARRAGRAFLALPLLVGQAEHKVMAHMQGRLGPMYAGGFHGWAQLVADGVKFVQKEDVVPARRGPHGLPARAGGRAAAVPRRAAGRSRSGPGWSAQDLDVGLFFVLAVMGVGVVGALMAGWASANKYSLLGGLRVGRPAAGLRAAVRARRRVASRWPPARCR